ncbi:MAG TPA: flagellar biosynthesis anti-sigma factor FlgM [Dissulfurispiraceae bacterium]|nr:flagellar biosynthesis anti-sigma factor FlgM [Dissulfurispiraceae bacterium]
MRISDKIDVGGVNFQKPDKAKDKASEGKPEAVAQNDEVSLSGAAKEIGRLQAEVSKLPDIRADRVEEIKNAINSGTYNVKGEAVAGKLIKNAIIDKLI